MVKLNDMDSADSQVLPAPPNLVKSLMAGFDAVANHIGILVIPIGLDLLLWLGPHVRMTASIQAFFRELAAVMEAGATRATGLATLDPEMIDFLAERFNLLTALRAYPVGVPSLMASRTPLEAPGGLPVMIEVPAVASALVIWLLLSVVGLGFGTMYFSLVAQAAVTGKVDWRRAVSGWPRAAGQVLLLALFWIILLLALLAPLSCLLSVAMLMGTGVGSLVFFLLGGALIWVSMPLLFSPHGIFVFDNNMLTSVRNSARLVRLTLPGTGLLLLILLVLSEGLDTLWRAPAETSWLTLVALAGHAFVTTGLLAASFVYYRDAWEWLQRMLAARQLKKA